MGMLQELSRLFLKGRRVDKELIFIDTDRNNKLEAYTPDDSDSRI